MAKTSDLAANPRNPRKVTDQRLMQLRRSLAEFGDLSGITYNRQTGQLVGGHARCRAWELDTPGAIEYDQRLDSPNATGTVATGRIVVRGETFAYREVEWDSDREKAANLAANRAAGEWDIEGLGEFLAELDEAHFDLDLTMFDQGEIAQHLGRKPPEGDGGEGSGDDEALAAGEAGPSAADQLPEPADCNVVRGELWALGRHRLLCGNALDDGDVARLVGEHQVGLVFTDPPYGMGLQVDYNGRFSHDSSRKGTTRAHKAVIGDDAPYDPAHLLRQLPAEAELVLWGADYYRQRLPEGGSWYCWDKRLTEAMDRVAGNGFELAWSRTPHKREVARILWSGNLGMPADDTRTRLHPTQKPVALVRWFFERLKGEVVADLFAGSGTTLIACEQSGQRTCLALEIDPVYCQVIIDRWQELTGKAACRLQPPPEAGGVE